MSAGTFIPATRTLTGGLLLLAAYVLSGKLGLMLALPPGYASPVFPPAGIAVAAVLIGGLSTLPWIFAGSLLLNIWAGYSANAQIDAIGLVAATLIAAASMLQAAIGGYGLRRTIGYPAALNHYADVLRFLLLSPIICLTSATLSVSGLSMLGVVDAENYATNWFSWWVGDTLGVILLLPLVMIFAGKPRALWRSRIFSVAIPISLIFSLFVVIFLAVNRWEYNDSLTEFRQYSLQAVNQLQAKFEEQESVLEQTAALFTHDAADKVTREEFHHFVAKSLNRFPMIQALEWAAPVDAAQRAAFEAEQRTEIPGFEIRERDADGQLKRAAPRNAYYPVTFVEPIAGNEAALGFDLASSPERLSTLNLALRSQTVVMTPSIHLVQERQQQAGALLILAIDPRDSRAGVVVSVLRIGDFMEKLLRGSQASLYTRLIDLDDQKILYDNFGKDGSPALYERTFGFGTRHFRLETAPTPVYFKTHRSWQSWSVLAAGVLGTGLLCALLLLGTGYAARIEAQVVERTAELTESKKRLQQAQHLAHVGSWELDIVQNRLICSDEIFHIFEIDPASFDASYEAFLNAIHPDDRPLVDRAYADAVKNRTAYDIEHRLLFPDGRIKHVHERGETHYDEDGRAIRSVGTIQDITERKLADELLKKSTEEIEDLYNHSPCGYHSLDQDGTICRINDTELAWLGYSRDEVVGKKRWIDLLTHRSQKVFEQNFEQFKKRGYINDLEFELVRRDGSMFVGLVNATAILDQNGDYAMSRSTVFDITERILAEEKIRNLAYYDTLTQLPNRRMLKDRLAHVLAVCRRTGLYGALMFMDLDNFKPLNDQYGHGVGDLLLIEVARRLSGCMRETDTVARFGGDEFVVLLGELDHDRTESTAQARNVAEKIRIALAQPYALSVQTTQNATGTLEHRCTSSIGVVLFNDGAQEDLLRWADMAMYQAKDAGRNQIRVYKPDSRPAA